MDPCSEPPIKRTRLENGFTPVLELIDSYIKDLSKTQNLQAVLSDAFHTQLPLVKVFCGKAKNQKELSNIIHILNQKIPLKNLQHLKRVSKMVVLLCPIHYLNGMPSIQEYLETNIQELKDSFEYFKQLNVPAVPPMIKSQMTSQLWPCNFHPNNYFEKLTSNTFFSSDEMALHKNFMGMVFEIAKWNIERMTIDLSADELLSKMNATVIVDPKKISVIAATFCSFTHPVQHSAMLAIDGVARTQKGGAWSVNENTNKNYLLSGIKQDLLEHLKSKYLNSFGSRSYVEKEDMIACKTNTPYLCTGYYVYMMKEPCIMCAMALVHARAKRVFFCFDNVSDGALKSRTKLQTIQSLNHHFEVFTGFL